MNCPGKFSKYGIGWKIENSACENLNVADRNEIIQVCFV